MLGFSSDANNSNCGIENTDIETKINKQKCMKRNRGQFWQQMLKDHKYEQSVQSVNVYVWLGA